MPYLASAVFAAGVIAETDTATISIDLGWQLHADPAVVDTLSVPALGRLILHLIGHVVRSHGDRALAAGVRKDIDRARWTRCADAEINDDLPQPLISEWAPDTPEKLGFEPGRLAEDYFAPTLESFREWDCGAGADGAPRPGDEDTGGGSGLRSGGCSDCRSRSRSRASTRVSPARSRAAGSGGPSRCCRPGPTGDGCWPPRSAAPCSASPARSTTATGGRHGGRSPAPTCCCRRCIGRCRRSRSSATRRAR